MESIQQIYYSKLFNKVIYTLTEVESFSEVGVSLLVSPVDKVN